MLEILEFVFQDFWHFIGFFLLFIVVCSLIEDLMRVVVMLLGKEVVDESEKEGEETRRPDESTKTEGQLSP